MIVCLFIGLARLQETYEQEPEEQFVQEEEQPADPAASAEDEQMRRSMTASACLALSRNHLSGRVSELNQAIVEATKNSKEQNNLIRRMYGRFTMTCMTKVSFPQVEAIYKARTEPELASFYYFFDGLDPLDIIGQGPKVLLEEQGIVKFIEEYDKSQELRRDEELVEDIEEGNKDILLFGVAFKQLSSSVKVVVVAVISAILIGALLLGFKMLREEEEAANPRKKKEKAR